jgi:hypothetical protein
VIFTTIWPKLVKHVTDAKSAGKSGQELIDAVLPNLKNDYGNWGFFDAFVKSNIRQTEEEATRTKRLPGKL